ncbi:hypothetical protein N0V84_003865 [Fusarium piperis]|uniref:Uncharacterized protein n=1 Tax=Fusarium piperis TaxID=1435070 RepID=A0A9W8WGK8_9HYPO|nr:hypothetical protein N0V84_003865 [Fusarium piperis]
MERLKSHGSADPYQTNPSDFDDLAKDNDIPGSSSSQRHVAQLRSDDHKGDGMDKKMQKQSAKKDRRGAMKQIAMPSKEFESGHKDAVSAKRHASPIQTPSKKRRGLAANSNEPVRYDEGMATKVLRDLDAKVQELQAKVQQLEDEKAAKYDRDVSVFNDLTERVRSMGSRIEELETRLNTHQTDSEKALDNVTLLSLSLSGEYGRLAEAMVNSLELLFRDVTALKLGAINASTRRETTEELETVKDEEVKVKEEATSEGPVAV